MNQKEMIEIIKESFNKISQLYIDIFLIDIKYNQTNQKIIISLDSEKPLTINYLTQIHRKMLDNLEKIHIFSKHNFSLELTSPGDNQPLVNKRQYPKNIGREIIVETTESEKKQGILKKVNDDNIIVETKSKLNKKEILKEEKIFFTQIYQTQIIFKI